MSSLSSVAKTGSETQNRRMEVRRAGWREVAREVTREAAREARATLRPTALPPLVVRPPLDGGQLSAGRVLRRSARRPSPYARPAPGPPTTGLSSALGDVSLGYAPRGKRRSTWPMPMPSDSRAGEAALVRQQAKEEAWKRKLSGAESTVHTLQRAPQAHSIPSPRRRCQRLAQGRTLERC